MKAIKLEFDEQPVIAHPRAICFGKFGSGLWTGKYRLLERLLDEVHFVEELSDLAGLAGEIDMLHCVKVQHLRSLESQSAIIRDSMLRALSLSERLRWGPGRTYLIASLDEAIGVGGVSALAEWASGEDVTVAAIVAIPPACSGWPEAEIALEALNRLAETVDVLVPVPFARITGAEKGAISPDRMVSIVRRVVSATIVYMEAMDGDGLKALCGASRGREVAVWSASADAGPGAVREAIEKAWRVPYRHPYDMAMADGISVALLGSGDVHLRDMEMARGELDAIFRGDIAIHPVSNALPAREGTVDAVIMAVGLEGVVNGRNIPSRMRERSGPWLAERDPYWPAYVIQGISRPEPLPRDDPPSRP